MAQNIYDNKDFFEGYATLNRSIHGLDGAPEWSSIVQMLPKLDGSNVVDLGCGYGWFSRYARQKGAAQVLGVDISEKMLSKARETTNDSKIIYRREDLETLKLDANTYDLAYSSLTLHYIVDLSSLVETIYHSLKHGGYFVFSAEHPIYTAPNNPGWITNKEDGRKSWPLNSYQMEGRRVTNWFADGVVKQHRLMATYLNLLIEKGFFVKHVEEWGPTEEQVLANPSLEEEKERPMMLLISAQKS